MKSLIKSKINKMKQIMLIAVVAVGGTISSCKKCHECHYDKAGAEIEIGEFCDDELTAIEENGYTIGDSTYVVHCEAH